MKLKFSLALLALAALGSGAAQARSNVYFNVGVQAAPGVAVNVGNVPPVVVAPAYPVYVAPAPVYYAPPPVYYVRPAPVYYGYGYAPVYYGHRHHGHRHGHGGPKGHRGHRH